MNLKEFMEENIITAFEVISGEKIINVCVLDERHAINVDTSNIESGTLLSLVEDFTVDNDILNVSGITVNINDIQMQEQNNLINELQNIIEDGNVIDEVVIPPPTFPKTTFPWLR